MMDKQAIKMNPAQLTREIATLRGWRIVVSPYSDRMIRNGTRILEYAPGFDWARESIEGEGGSSYGFTNGLPSYDSANIAYPDIPDYLSDANEALELVAEMDIDGEAQFDISRCCGTPRQWYARTCNGLGPVTAYADSFCAVICLAWYEWKTGHRVDFTP